MTSSENETISFDGPTSTKILVLKRNLHKSKASVINMNESYSSDSISNLQHYEAEHFRPKYLEQHGIQNSSSTSFNLNQSLQRNRYLS